MARTAVGLGRLAELSGWQADRTRAFRRAALLYLACFLAHNGDHLRRGVDVLTPEVLWAGSAAGIAASLAIALALVGHRLAPLVAVATGFPTALGVAAVHLLPPWSAFSDAFPGGEVDALSWLAVLLEIAGALAFGVVGALLLPAEREGSHEV
ncbi:MAG TPA: hypothetical protein VGL23_00875 [Chloroflexota bacterium]